MSVSPFDEDLFQKACDEIINIEREKNGIGTAHQEFRIGRYVADIFRGDEIIEIQTRNFNAMRRKLDLFLEQYPVTIVYPIVHTKWLCWIDEATGEISKKRKSPKKGTTYDAYYELYKIKQYLVHPNLHLCLVLIDAEEYRLLNGWSRDKKRGSTRFDRIPTKLVDEFYIGNPKEYGCMIPEDLPEPFSSKDFARKAGISQGNAQLALNILNYIEAVARVGKKGNAYLYKLNL